MEAQEVEIEERVVALVDELTEAGHPVEVVLSIALGQILALVVQRVGWGPTETALRDYAAMIGRLQRETRNTH